MAPRRRGWREQLKTYLLAGVAEEDPGFRQDVQRQSLLGLKVVGGACIAISCFLILARFFIAPDPGTLWLRLAQGTAISCLGVVLLGLAQHRGAERHARSLSLVAGWIVSAVMIWVRAADVSTL